MPDARGRFLGISVPAEAWDRVFGDRMAAHDHDWGSVHTCHAKCPCHAGGEPVPDFLEQNPSADGRVSSCAHAQVEYESHSLIRYCGDCGVDLD
jgi:hypothetical protein